MAQSHAVSRRQGWGLRLAGISRLVPVPDKLWVWLLFPQLSSQIYHLSTWLPFWQKSNLLSQGDCPCAIQG